MNKHTQPDVDIDIADHDAVADLFKDYTVSASQLLNGKFVKHNVGMYFQKIPRNPITELAVFDYKHADQLRYYKVDVIPNSIYDDFNSTTEIRQLLDEPIDWDWFTDVNFVGSLFQFANWSAIIVVRYKPQSILDLACLLALIRPGKKYLRDQTWTVIKEKIWLSEPKDRGPTFKKSHSLAYALAVGIDARLKAPGYFNGMAG